MVDEEVKSKKMIIVREFTMARDAAAVEEMELRCDLNPTTATNTGEYSGKNKNKKHGGISLIIDQMGDPMCRIRHFPEHVMMVAEYGEKKEIVGVVRACIKVVTRGREAMTELPLFAKVAYILGLRVSPTHRRLGIGTRLVEEVEEWSRRRGAEYAYLATEPSNAASLALFTGRLGYVRHRSPVVLVRPVHAHRLPLGRPAAAVLRLPPPLAAALYRRLFLPSSEFFPSDFPSLLSHPLSLATFLALPRSCVQWDPQNLLRGGPLPESFAVASLWNNAGVFRLRVVGAPAMARALLAVARAVDEKAPWMRVPSVRDVMRPFGVYLMYGLHARGKHAAALVRALCHLAHNIAVDDEGCAAVVAEVGRDDPVAATIPHWRRFSCQEDVWCMKRLVAGVIGGGDDNWVKAEPTTDVIFVDPREF